MSESLATRQAVAYQALLLAWGIPAADIVLLARPGALLVLLDRHGVVFPIARLPATPGVPTWALQGNLDAAARGSNAPQGDLALMSEAAEVLPPEALSQLCMKLRSYGIRRQEIA